MKKKNLLLIAAITVCSIVMTGCQTNSIAETPAEVTTDVVETEAAEAEVAEEEYFDEEFLKIFAEAITRRQELGEKISNALTVEDVLQKELAMHPDYATKNFKDDVLQTYAIHYRESVEKQLNLWKDDPRSGKKTEGYMERDFDEACSAWITQVEAVNALVNDYDLQISDTLVEEYRIEKYFWMSGLYRIFWKNGIDNTSILFDNIEKNIDKDEEGNSVIKLGINNNTKYDLTGIHILVYHQTKTGYVLEEDIPVDLWEIDEKVDVEFSVKEKYEEKDHIMRASSGLALSMYPNKVVWI